MTHPDVSCTALGEGKDDSVRYGCYGNESVGLKKGNAVLCSDPQLPATVLKEGLRLTRQPTVWNLPNRAARLRTPSPGESADWGATAHARASGAIHRDVALVPSVQPFRCAQPKTAIPRGENGQNPSARETLLVRKCWDREVAKPVQAFRGRHPNIAFPILKQRLNGRGQQAFGLAKPIRSPLVDMQEPAVHQGADPQATIVIPKQPVRLELQPGRKRIRFGLPVRQLCNSA